MVNNLEGTLKQNEQISKEAAMSASCVGPRLGVFTALFYSNPKVKIWGQKFYKCSEEVRGEGLKQKIQPSSWLLRAETRFWGSAEHLCLGGFRHVQPGEGHKAGPEPAGETTSPSWPGNTLVFPQKSWRRWLGRGRSGPLCLSCCPPEPNPDKWKLKDWWTIMWLITKKKKKESIECYLQTLRVDR